MQSYETRRTADGKLLVDSLTFGELGVRNGDKLTMLERILRLTILRDGLPALTAEVTANETPSELMQRLGLPHALELRR